MPSPLSVPAAPRSENESEGMSRHTFIALWWFVGVFTLGCIIFLVWHFHSSNQARIAGANDRIAQAVATAKEWAAGKSLLDDEAAERQLAEALKDEVATEKGSAESVLSQVRQRREQLAMQREAAAILEDAKKRLDEKEVAEAMALLEKYLAHPHATEKADAQRLLAEAEMAVSDMLTLDALIVMSDEEFDRVKASTVIDDGKVKHPVLVAVREVTTQRNLDKAAQRREELKLAEEKRREAERLVALERQRQEDARRQAQEEELVRANEPFDLKGDRLGMSLKEFKAKYTRKVEGHNESAPFSSETRPRQELPTLLAESWHTDAGIVNCSITFPFEAFRGNAPTIADVKTELLVHHFVDGKLYRITAWLPHDGYLKVKMGLIAKEGDPDREETSTYQNSFGATFTGESLTWTNAVSTITLTERFGRLDTSALVFEHRELAAMVHSRTPAPTDEDL
jgi:hypothetical protein